MPVKATITFNKSEIAAKVMGASAKAAESVAMEILADSNFYAPFRSGALIGKSNLDGALSPTVENYPDEGRTVISWRVPYARRMYEGKSKSGKPFKYGKQSNPNAQSKWFEKAKSLKLADWRKFFEKMLKQEMEGSNG